MDRERDDLSIGDLTFDGRGLIPAVAQQFDSGEVLMVAWMDRESLARTLRDGEAWYFSRSRQRLWRKGETSGNVQLVREVRYDCDADTLLVLVDQQGAGACHTANRSCFYRTLKPVQDAGPMDEGTHPVSETTDGAQSLGAVIEDLYAVLEQRKAEMPEGSYTAKLLGGPQDKLLKKIAEEAGEVIIAARDGDNAATRYEIADLVYHLLVVMVREGVTPEALAAELAGRRR
jgi:phosphoribosyl-AMP cyclohydrolase / phosphoribosyl-ATP pyrophosphohydrolase